MTNTYKFDIVQIFTSDIDLNSNKDELVQKIEFSLIGYREDQNTFIIDTIDIPISSGDIIPYNQLNKDIFISWVTKFLGEEKINQMKLEIDNRLDEMINHFAQFKDENASNLIKPSLPPWANTNIPEDVFNLIVTPSIPEGI